jgi:hypothetical protein
MALLSRGARNCTRPFGGSARVQRVAASRKRVVVMVSPLAMYSSEQVVATARALVTNAARILLHLDAGQA